MVYCERIVKASNKSRAFPVMNKWTKDVSTHQQSKTRNNKFVFHLKLELDNGLNMYLRQPIQSHQALYEHPTFLQREHRKQETHICQAATIQSVRHLT